MCNQVPHILRAYTLKEETGRGIIKLRFAIVMSGSPRGKTFRKPSVDLTTAGRPRTDIRGDCIVRHLIMVIVTLWGDSNTTFGATNDRTQHLGCLGPVCDQGGNGLARSAAWKAKPLRIWRPAPREHPQAGALTPLVLEWYDRRAGRQGRPLVRLTSDGLPAWWCGINDVSTIEWSAVKGLSPGQSRPLMAKDSRTKLLPPPAITGKTRDG